MLLCPLEIFLQAHAYHACICWHTLGLNVVDMQKAQHRHVRFIFSRNRKRYRRHHYFFCLFCVFVFFTHDWSTLSSHNATATSFLVMTSRSTGDALLFVVTKRNITNQAERCFKYTVCHRKARKEMLFARKKNTFDWWRLGKELVGCRRVATDQDLLTNRIQNSRSGSVKKTFLLNFAQKFGI